MIIMDFDGVIADSHDAILDAINALAVKRKKQPISREEYAATSIRDLFSKLAISKFLTPYYVGVLRKGITQNFSQLRIHEEILPVLAWAQRNNVPLAVLSSNSTQVIRRFLATHTPEFQFAVIEGNCALWAKHRRLAKIAIRQGSSVKTSVYLGDETRDVDAAHRVGMRSIAVTWGKDSADLLVRSSPYLLAHAGQDIVDYLQSHAAPAA